MMDSGHFSFTVPSRIIFGWGARDQLPEVLKPFGKNLLLICSKSVAQIWDIENQLTQASFSVQKITVCGEPTDIRLQEILQEIQHTPVDAILGVGGGSVLDTGKAISALITNGGCLNDYLEVVGRGQALQKTACPYVAVPSTAGTGTEVTKNAVIKVISQNVKVSMRDILMIPRIALIDPELTVSLPSSVTAATGMDALIQVLEPYCSQGANKMVDLFCREGIPLAAKNLPIAFHDPRNRDAREAMAWVSLLGGLSLANAKLGAVHGFAGPIGGMFDVAHGTICACLLPQVFRMNAKKVQEMNDQEMHRRFLDIARWVTGMEEARIENAVGWFIGLNEMLAIPRLKDLGILAKDFSAIIEKSLNSSSMKGNPVRLEPDDLKIILENS